MLDRLLSLIQQYFYIIQIIIIFSFSFISLYLLIKAIWYIFIVMVNKFPFVSFDFSQTTDNEDGVILFSEAIEPSIYLFSNFIDNAAYACFSVVASTFFIKHYYAIVR